MDSELFKEWVREQDRKFALEDRKVALVIDNCTAHPNTESIKSIALNFLPINATSCSQSMDQRVIQPLKFKYHTRIIKTIITLQTAENKYLQFLYLKL